MRKPSEFPRYGDCNKRRQYIPRTPLPTRDFSLIHRDEILSVFAWNVNGLRALLKKRPEKLVELWNSERIDVLGICETKVAGDAAIIDSVESAILELLGADNVMIVWNPGSIKGYAGTAAIVRLDVAKRMTGFELGPDSESRRITLRFQNISVVIVYVPNSGMHLRRLPFRLKEWDPELAGHCIRESTSRKFGVVVAGDFNCAQRDVDIWNLEQPAILKGAGTTLEERASFKSCFPDQGLRDSFAEMYPNDTGWFTYWSIRAKNKALNRGLRLDYVLTDGKTEILDSVISEEYAAHGDHCPVGVILHVPRLGI